MTNAALNQFRQLLEQRQTEIGSESVHRDALAIDSSPEEMDRIQNASARDYAVSNLERNASQLREVRAALRRLDEGNFGICVHCEEAISPKRLAAIPWASFCIVCQEAADRQVSEPPAGIEPSFVIAA